MPTTCQPYLPWAGTSSSSSESSLPQAPASPSICIPQFTFAQGAAVSGRNAIALAPSLPPISGGAGHELPKPLGNADEIADDLAGLASALSMRLRESAELAADAADRSACENAASEAGRITWLLAQGK